jgi:hypothetical protein
MRVSAPLEPVSLLQFDEDEGVIVGEPSRSITAPNGHDTADGEEHLGKSVDSSEPLDISEVDVLLDHEDDVVEAKVNRKVSRLHMVEKSA